ncbi:hypothetical protein [Amycolatopsis sp. H20-H5]|uniref:hypothetical protein n=1 Tax=Amycolatopsis sp. H20-H5 TaxID=3046309 RepID=UPI002DC03E5A|nr:hypothetical protein [Amycolatopsis sp. H20-H5]MEC3973804.1 hypothetical protein [Amycolatopsis sp. H20-H5]
MSFSGQRVTWREWLGLGAGLLALGSLFLPWTTLSTSQSEVADALKSLSGAEVVRDGWSSGLFAWLPPLLLLVVGVAVTVFGQVRKVRISGLPQLWLVFGGLVALMTIIGWGAIAYQFDSEVRALFAVGGIEVNAGAGRYLGSLALVVSLAAAVLDVLAFRGERRSPRR